MSVVEKNYRRLAGRMIKYNEITTFEITSISFLIVILLSSHVYAIQGIPTQEPSSMQLKALELTIQIHQFFLALVGAVYAYLLVSGRELLAIFKQSCGCLKKISVVFCVLFLFVTAFALVWNLYTITNQLRNDFQNLDDLVNENIYFSCLALGLAFFLPTVYSIWKEKNG